MKKKILLILVLFFLCGCTKIKESDYNDILVSAVTSKYNIINKNRTGYKYYLPNEMASLETNDYNEILASSKYKYYLYVDVVSYYNRIINEYNVNSDAYYSAPINYEDKYGYLEINKQKNGKYLVEIMYNYAKIEIIVDEKDLKEVVTNSIIILSSINYNSNILESVIGDNALEFNEENYNIFETKKENKDFLDVETENEEVQEELEDPDLVD